LSCDSLANRVMQLADRVKTVNSSSSSSSLVDANGASLLSCLCGVQAAMRDRWLNTGYHGDELQPHVEPPREIDDDRVGKQLDLRPVSSLSICLTVNRNLMPNL